VRAALALILVAAPAFAETPARPPAGLACLARFYAVAPLSRDGAWFGRLPDGRELAWDDRRAKSFDERLDAPDLHDWFSIRYRKGALVPVTAPDDDPGRIRVDALFEATYPIAGITKVQFLDRMLQVHQKVAPAFSRVATKLAALVARNGALAPFLKDLGGTFVRRNIAGTNRPSAHSYGVSIDLNPSLSAYWRWQKPPTPIKWTNKIPQEIVDAFEAEGFIWGGRWYHYDTMHFEYRPELLDENCWGRGAY
jgi:hypothetical protein